MESANELCTYLILLYLGIYAVNRFSRENYLYLKNLALAMNIFDMLVHKSNMALRNARAVLYKPLLAFLTRLGITAFDVTNFRLALAFVFLIIYYYVSPYWSAIFMIGLYWLDTVDGALARHQNTSTDRGKFYDVLVDTIVYLFPIFTFVYSSVNIYHLIINLTLLNYVYLLAIIKKNEHEQTDWLINPYPKMGYLRLPAMFAFWAHHFLGINYLNASLVFSNVLAIIMFFFYYITIQMNWAKSKKIKI